MQIGSPLNQLKSLALPLIAFSFVTNIAVLISPIFMMQVLDRVVPSGNLNTLALLLAVAFIAIATQGFVEFFRDVSFARVSIWIESVGTHSALNAMATSRQSLIENTGILSHFFKSSLASHALNIPWLPLFALALALINPLFLLLVFVISFCTFSIKFITHLLTKNSKQQAKKLAQSEVQTLSDSTNLNIASGMQSISENLNKRYYELQKKRHSKIDEITTLDALNAASTNSIRMFAQILALSLGAYLVIDGAITSGGMIGASIIVSKSIATIESSVNGVPAYKEAYASFKTLCEASHQNKQPTDVGKLSGKLTAQGLIYPRAPGAQPRLEKVSFSIEPGECLAIVGDSGSGKTTLLHALSAIDPCPIGTVFYDESEVRTLSSETLRYSIGYLPQQARFESGTIGENISCFAESPEDKKIITAAKTSGVHGLISSLPQAYETDMRQNPHLLSAGQKQRVALARAIYENPKYLFLDEPNALLDSSGERQLCDALAHLKRQGTTIVMVLHRSGIMGLADKVLVLENGRIADFGPRSDVLGRMNDGKQRIQLPLNLASLQDLNDWIVAQFSRHSDKEFCQKAILVATELFNASHQNGAQDIRRECNMTFKFLTENKCEILLSEDTESQAVAKMEKIKKLVDKHDYGMFDLEPDEVALALVAKMTDALEVKNHENASYFAARITSDRHTSPTHAMN